MSKGNERHQGPGVGLKLGMELIMTTLVGSVMGYALDKFLNTSPWLLVMGVFFGATAGCLSAYRWAQGVADNNSDDKSD